MPANSKHRLCIVQVMASGPGSGGIEKHFFELCNRLARDHSVIAVCHPAYRAGFDRDVQFESLGRLIGRRNPATIVRLIRILKKWRPDVVHAHASRAAVIVLQAAPFTDALRVATVHGLKRATLVFRGFHRVIAVSKGVAAQLPGIPADVIYNGITVPQLGHRMHGQFPLAPFANGWERPIVASVGRLDSVKGFDVLIDAWQEIDGLLLIIGDGPQREALESQIARRGLSDRVKLLGFRQDVPDLLTLADLTVIASRREGFGYTLAEALLLRRLVVSTDVPAANEILPRAYLTRCGDPQALRATILSTLANRPASYQDFEPVWDRAAQVFTLDAMVAATDGLYRQAVDAKKAA